MPTKAKREKYGPPYKRGPYTQAGSEIGATDPIAVSVFERAQALGWSDGKLAARAGFERSGVYSLRTGRTQGKLHTLRTLAQAVGYDIGLTLRKDAPALPRAPYAGKEGVGDDEA